jgi:hypothetical protein
MVLGMSASIHQTCNHQTSLEGVGKFHVPGLYISHQRLESTAAKDTD